MAQSLTQNPVNTFIKGLITEATPLTFPENASVDEDNCELSVSGLRSRRRGMEYEASSSLSSFTTTFGELIHDHTWKNVSGESGVDFLVVQVGATLYFYDKSVAPISGNEKSFTVDLTTFDASNGESVSATHIFGTSIKGNFVVVSAAIESFFIEYDSGTDTITTTQITPKIRDFEWQGDTSTYDAKIATGSVTDARKYDTYNAGWVDALEGSPVLTTYNTDNTAWPPITHPWFSGKNSSGVFKTLTWEKVYGGNSLIGNGRFILDLYSKDRGTASGVVSLGIETESARFTTITSMGGRTWFSGIGSKKNGANIYFSPVLEDMTKMGNFFQEADPTSEDQSDLVDSDGGVINIPAAARVRSLFAWGASILVFAENGVWQISGVDGVFKATSFSVSRVLGADGLVNPFTLIDADGTPIWWGNTGIYTISIGDVSQTSSGSDISRTTVQTLFDGIAKEDKLSAIAEYDKTNKRIYWLYSNDASSDHKYNKALILDLQLQAFIPWTFSDETTDTNYVAGLSFFDGSTVEEIKFIVRDGTTGSITFATPRSTTFKDWTTEDYSSFAVAGYDFQGDMSTVKEGVYVTTYFDITETGFTGDETNGYDFVNPSSCTFKAFWDLRTSPSSTQEAYRFLIPIIVDTGDLNSFNYPYLSVITRNRILGRGRNLKLRFESVSGKDFQLQGYEVIGAKNQSL